MLQTIGLIMGGRHPGYYFKTETSDLVKSDIVCPKSYSNDSINIGRGGAVAELVASDIVLCGGRDKMNEVMDTCSKYNMREHMWAEHSQLLVPREEAASAVLAGQVIIFQESEYLYYLTRAHCALYQFFIFASGTTMSHTVLDIVYPLYHRTLGKVTHVTYLPQTFEIHSVTHTM